ncbi:Os12g0504550 [Oryza sativa Japonica Group]|uniref:Os12g0504550 protein n=1 Tax=Oryza sativa subsp. japonica TaxID=39947 RepID=A0A0P0YAM8_ORYSJ|nr:Os12g0504550 [Oryza sativa Japonica Group]
MGVTRGDAAPCFLEGNRSKGAVVVPRGRLGEAAAGRDGGGWASGLAALAAWARRRPGVAVAWGSCGLGLLGQAGHGGRGGRRSEGGRRRLGR